MYKHSKEMVSMKKQKKVPCSTPEPDSPSRDSDSMCESDASSPVPFLCTQDGAEGEIDVVWNFYTPKSLHTTKSRFENSTPVSRRSKRLVKTKIIDKQLPKRRPIKLPQKKTELFQELVELNQNLHELIAKKPQNNCSKKVNSGSEDDIFNESPENSPKSRRRSDSLCLRRNVLSSNFIKIDPDTALDSDDSMNECLMKASQMVEENIKTESTEKLCCDPKINNKTIKSDLNFKMDQDSMDAILNSIKFESTVINDVKKHDSPKLNNDSFDSIVGNLNDSVLEKLTHKAKMDTSRTEQNNNTANDLSNWSIKDLIVHDNTSSPKCYFSRHSSMPESPNIETSTKPSTSGMVFGRYNSMPFKNDSEVLTELGDSPTRCTPEEIKKKHQLAREKLMARRLLPFTATQKTVQSTQVSQVTQVTIPKRPNEILDLPKNLETVTTKKFQPRVPSKVTNAHNKSTDNIHVKANSNSPDIKSLIEKKRQEALMKLRRRQIQSKII